MTKEQADYQAKRGVLSELLARMMIRRIGEAPSEYSELAHKWAADLNAIFASEENDA